MEPNTESSILFIVAHPYLERSRANRAVLGAVHDIPGLNVRNIYDLYPYFHIDVEEEQKHLLAHDLIVIQHPFYWYSMPALLKLWLDEVWLCGWAYGPEGDKLRGKKFLLSITAGGPEDAYSTDGYNRFPVETLLSPWAQTVNLCGMKWHEPLVMHGSIRASEDELARHAERLRNILARFTQTGALA